LNDRIEAVRTCYLSFQVSGVNALCDEIEALFSDDESTVLLSTVHRAKGLEKPRIFLLFPDKVPLEWPNQKDWEFEQELHLKYVALTRAKEALFFVHEKPKQKKRRGAFEDAA
jgi:DNA helicase-2/ATP-dependent DNA helicase PcrA